MTNRADWKPTTADLDALPEPMRRYVDSLRATLEPFTFAAGPAKFDGDDSAMNEVVVCDEHVQAARKHFPEYDF